MNLNQLHYFVTLAHIEHYTRAAEMLSITQPSLSHAISMLEQELETNLFEKRGRNVVLTKYGKVFLEYVEEALKILDSGVKKTRALTSDTGGVIDLAYIFTLGSVFVPQLVGGFLKEHADCLNRPEGHRRSLMRSWKMLPWRDLWQRISELQ